MPGSGLFCVFEGLDGSGKSTLLENTAARLRQSPEFAFFSGLTSLKEPTELETGLVIRRRLKESTDADPAEWLELFQTDRARNVEVNIRPGLAANRLLLQDRYFYSTAAYQGVAPAARDAEGAGFTPAQIVADSLARGFPEPGLLLYLEIDPDTALERIDRGRSGRETFETRERLRAIAERYESILPASALRLDATAAPDELTARTVDLILGRIRDLA